MCYFLRIYDARGRLSEGGYSGESALAAKRDAGRRVRRGPIRGRVEVIARGRVIYATQRDSKNTIWTSSR